MTPATTRRSEAMLRDLDRIQREADWLARHLGDLDAIAHSKPHQASETGRAGHQAAVDSPALSDTGQPALRELLREVERLLRRTAIDVTRARVNLEKTFAGPGADIEMIGTLLEPGELDAARAAKARRDAHAGDPRWGEWEATAAEQPATSYRGR